MQISATKNFLNDIVRVIRSFIPISTTPTEETIENQSFLKIQTGKTSNQHYWVRIRANDNIPNRINNNTLLGSDTCVSLKDNPPLLSERGDPVSI